jgi:hypothetical protein
VSGIPYWRAKRIALLGIFAAQTDTEVIRKVLKTSEPDEEDYERRVRSVCAMYPQWETRAPTKHDGPKIFFSCLLQDCSNQRAPSELKLISGDTATFLSCFGRDAHHAALARLNQSADDCGLTAHELQKLNHQFDYTTDTAEIGIPSLRANVRLLTRHFTVYHSSTAALLTVRKGIEAGEISQALYYQSPDAAASWLALINSPNYPSYNHCAESLEKLTNSPAWSNTLRLGHHARIVMLGGGGSPSKDMLLIESALELVPKVRGPVRHVLVDLSTPLLVDSTRFILRELARRGIKEDVELRLIEGDFLRLQECSELLEENGNTIWAITAGTLGNVREREFFNSLNTRAATRDLLIVSADTFEEEPVETFRTTIEQKYRHEDMLNFLAAPLGVVLQLTEAHESVANALRRVKICVDDDLDSSHSDVPGSRFVEFSIDLKGRKLLLLNSNRYHEPDLVDFARDHGWQHLTTVRSSANERFRQLLFVRR